MEKIGSYLYRVAPYQGNAQSEAPLSLLAQWILDAATQHAESWGVGYSTLIQKNHVWVLARLGIELDRFPRIGETIHLETWIEDYNKHFSMRNFAFTDDSGKAIGYARTIWSVIDLASRASLDLESFEFIAQYISDKECPIEKLNRIGSISEEHPTRIRVLLSDIDLNRHQNSVKYIDQMMNLFPLSLTDTHRIARFEINYSNEARYGLELELHRAEKSPGEWQIETKNSEIGTLCRGKVLFLPRS